MTDTTDHEPALPEEPTAEQLLLALYHHVQETNEHLRQIRTYIGLLLLIAIAGVVLFVLWLTGVFTVEFRPISTRF